MRFLFLGFGGKLGVGVSIALDSEIHPGERDHQAGVFGAAAFWAGIGEQIFHRLLEADSEIGHGLDLRGGQVVVGIILRGDRDVHKDIQDLQAAGTVNPKEKPPGCGGWSVIRL